MGDTSLLYGVATEAQEKLISEPLSPAGGSGCRNSWLGLGVSYPELGVQTRLCGQLTGDLSGAPLSNIMYTWITFVYMGVAYYLCMF